MCAISPMDWERTGEGLISRKLEVALCFHGAVKKFSLVKNRICCWCREERLWLEKKGEREVRHKPWNTCVHHAPFHR